MQQTKGNAAEAARLEEWTDAERSAIADEADRILADSAFKNSKRCQALFRCLVDRALAGEHEGIKERTIGNEVFGRDVNYDTAVDPVVRITANEIRKRLAQWYQEPDHHHKVRIRLLAGTYLLRFEFVNQERAAEAGNARFAPGVIAAPEPQSRVAEAGVAPVRAASARFRSRWVWSLVAALIATATLALAARHYEIFSPRDYMAWKPLLESPQPLTICISDDSPIVQGALGEAQQVIADAIDKRQAPAADDQPASHHTTPMVDAEGAEKVSTWLAMHGRKAMLTGSTAVSLRDFRQGPIVLIGGYNPWSLIMLSNLRYSVRVDPVARNRWIQDSQNPARRDWKIEDEAKNSDYDYAIITRYFDTDTGQWIMSIGGLRPHGTEAGSDLLTDSSYLKSLPANLRSTGNFQIVLKTNVINGSAGPPQVLAYYTW